MVNVTYDACKSCLRSRLTYSSRRISATACLDGSNHTGGLCIWLRRHCMGPHLNCSRMAHDSWRWFLLFWLATEKKRIVDDFRELDGGSGGFFPSK